MSRTSGEPHIAVSILDSVFRIVFLVLTLFLLYEGATKGYWLGHEIFNPTAVEAEPGRMRIDTAIWGSPDVRLICHLRAAFAVFYTSMMIGRIIGFLFIFFHRKSLRLSRIMFLILPQSLTCFSRQPCTASSTILCASSIRSSDSRT